MVKKLFVIIACLCLCSCLNTRHTEQSVLEHQKQIDRVEEGKRIRDRAIEECIRELALITGRSEEMGGDVEDIIRELDLYHTAVQRLLRAAGYRTDEEQAVEESSIMSDQYIIYFNYQYSNSAILGIDT